ncbi:hypothetical protein MM221_04090 [Salipaludibacillus sp. LMS25]|jgi:aminoglycoside 3'-phosphotransferase-2|uniref:hypothetical protein n=1 Tax=Salipaludibacillus sp. LMS25 TaxID=2924031 RepID=UPI0020D1562B|nr:hypothetical protein [Salipaludibacillus sp. LMS25]UTR15772.1 hypothetical protein MM221_04090 [Salipaludibacillus sp. LMS25]
MTKSLRSTIEEIIGELNEVILLDEQGCTSWLIYTKKLIKRKYRAWLKAEALVLEKLNNWIFIPRPNFYGFIKGTDSGHVIMSFEEGLTLTYALKHAKTIDEKKFLLTSYFISFMRQKMNY